MRMKKTIRMVGMVLLMVAGCALLSGCATEAYYPPDTPVYVVPAQPVYVYPGYYPYYHPYYPYHHPHHW